MLAGLEKVEMEKLSLCENKSFPAKAFHCGAVQYQEVARAARVCKLQLFSHFFYLYFGDEDCEEGCSGGIMRQRRRRPRGLKSQAVR